MLLLLLSLSCAPARAGNVEARLLSSVSAAAPGEAFDAGLRLAMKDGWHTYWVNPGDSGGATRLSWKLPPGWSAGPLEWPAPRRIAAPPLASFGYSGSVVLPARLTPPASAAPGTRARLEASASWVECKEICLPGEAKIALVVPVARRARPGPHAPALAAARAAVPRPGPASALASWDGARVLLRLPGQHPRAEFFPSDWGVFESSLDTTVGPDGTELALRPAPGARVPETLAGVLTRPGAPPVLLSLPIRAESALARGLLLAFLGGLLLNLMPCVFPVLSIKVLGLLGRGRSGASALKHAAAYSAGVVLSFEALAGGLLAARAAGAGFGWGFQLQSPPLVAGLALLFALLGADLLGLVHVGTRWMSLGAAASRREGLPGSFFSGVFAVVVAAPCTAPFMGAALGWALTQPAARTLAVFGALGLGAAAPYAVLASRPSLLARLPRPGPWMETLKKALSVPMFAAALWLGWVFFRLMTAAPAPEAFWKAWSPEAAAQARAAGKTVFTDFTAAWCLTCQVNERVALADPAVRTALARPDVAALRADWTARDARITDELARHRRSGVPLYVVEARGGEPILLPEVLTPRLVLDALGPAPEPGEPP